MLTSLIFYMVVFFFVLICFFISEHLPEKQKKYTIIFEYIGLLTLCIIAGLRGENVGVDVKVYIIKNCNIAKNIDHLLDIYNSSQLNIGREYLFGLLLYISTRFKYSVQILQFLLQFLTVWPIYKACKIIKEKHKDFSITLGIAVYMFLFYNNSFNMMRQSVAIGFIILGIVSIIANKKIFEYIIPIFLALISHKSSLIGILLLLVILFVIHNNKKLKKIYIILLNIFIILLPAVIQFLYNTLVSYGISNVNYDYYNDIFINKNIDSGWFINPTSSYSLCFILFIIIFSLIHLSSVKKNSEKNTKDNDSILFSKIVMYGYLIYLIVLFSYKTMYGVRISIMLDMFNIIALPLIVSNNKKYSSIIILSIFMCWLLLVIKLGWSGSNIYTFFD